MKKIALSIAASAFLLPAAFAQTAAPLNSSQADAMSSMNDNMAAMKIQQDLQNAGFTDVKVVAESYVIQAKTKSGNPVVMTVGPNGMSVFEAMNNLGSSSASGSGSGSNATTGMGSSGSTSSTPPAQK